MAGVQTQYYPILPYDVGLDLMLTLHRGCVAGEIKDTLLILQHHPVITRGRRLHGQMLPNEQYIRAQGIEIRDADRGGLLTYHGPGQIVVYFILKLEHYFNGVSQMVQMIEGVLVDFLKGQGVEAQTVPDYPGVWVGSKKIASLGLRVADGVTRHGLSLNVCNDLKVYHLFDPCGLKGTAMTNLSEACACDFSGHEIKAMAQNLAELFVLELTHGQASHSGAK